MKVPVCNVDLYILRDFLDASECAALVYLIDANCRPSRLMSKHPDPEFRTSETCHLDPGVPVVCAVEFKLADLLGIEPALGERIQGQRYGAGEQYKAHHDFLRTSEPYWALQEQIGGQRTWTAMVFLDVPERGGETYFPLIEVKIPARRGSLIAWDNLAVDGEPNKATLHQGLPVIAGVKHIIPKWYRERPWGIRSKRCAVPSGMPPNERR